MKTSSKVTGLALVLALGLGALFAQAATTLKELEEEAIVTDELFAEVPSGALSPTGEALVVWGRSGSLEGQLFGADGEPAGGVFFVGNYFADFLGPLATSADPLGYSVAWSDDDNRSPEQSSFRRFDAEGRPVRDQVVLGRDIGSVDVDSDRRGGSVVVAASPEGIVGWRFDAAGRQTGRRFRVTAGTAFGPRVAVDGRGNFVVLWWSLQGIFGRRFNAVARPQGPAFQVTAEKEVAPLVAGNEDGTFVVVWTSRQGILSRVYRPSGPRRTVLVTSQAEAGAESVAMDPRGRFLVTWSCCVNVPRRLSGRLFAASGRPLGAPFQIGTGPGARQDDQSVASAGRPGEFLVVWRRLYEESGAAIVSRRLTLD